MCKLLHGSHRAAHTNWEGLRAGWSWTERLCQQPGRYRSAQRLAVSSGRFDHAAQGMPERKPQLATPRAVVSSHSRQRVSSGAFFDPIVHAEHSTQHPACRRPQPVRRQSCAFRAGLLAGSSGPAAPAACSMRSGGSSNNGGQPQRPSTPLTTRQSCSRPAMRVRAPAR